MEIDWKAVAYLIETTKPSTPGVGTPGTIFGLPSANAPAEVVFSIEKAVENRNRILDWYAISVENFLLTSGALAYTPQWSVSHTLPAGCFVVPENLWVKYRQLQGPVVSELLSNFVGVSLDYYEFWVPTTDYLRLAGITGSGAIPRRGIFS
ncbi:MAG TPA: hypothetical protein EYO33_23105 [Phycisphaerales bacterium]|nr:hypothetical protein [Phycisphaerales bacterium]